MKRVRVVFGLFGLLCLLPTAYAGDGGMLRLACEGDAAGAEVFINGKFKGDCPMDVAVAAGTLNIRVVKPVDSDHIKVFTTTLRIGDDVVKKVEVALESQLTPAGKKRADQRAAEEAKREAIRQAEEARRDQEVIRNIEMATISAGSFAMGSNDGSSDEKPVHTVNVGRFELGKYEVTQGQWKAVMGNNPSHFSSCGDTCPVEQVSWDDAQSFIQKLNQMTGKQYRLPSESEWEYACRAGQNHTYCGSDDVGNVAWYGDNSGRSTHSAGQKRPNAFGLYDMSGNVSEWVQDWHVDSYNGAPTDGSAQEGVDWYRVLRGGSWNGNAEYTRAANRINLSPTLRYDDNGFRLARTLP